MDHINLLLFLSFLFKSLFIFVNSNGINSSLYIVEFLYTFFI